MLKTPVPPPLRWERATDAARRLGFPSADLLQSELAVGRVPVRSARLGKRSMLYLCAADVDMLGALLAAGALS